MYACCCDAVCGSPAVRSASRAAEQNRLTIGDPFLLEGVARRFRWLIWILAVSVGGGSFADRVADERVQAAYARMQLRPEQKEPFNKILKDYYSRRNAMYRRESERSGSEEIGRRMKASLNSLGQKTLKEMTKVLDERQMDEANSLIDAATDSFLSDMEHHYGG